MIIWASSLWICFLTWWHLLPISCLSWASLSSSFLWLHWVNFIIPSEIWPFLSLHHLHQYKETVFQRDSCAETWRRDLIAKVVWAFPCYWLYLELRMCASFCPTQLSSLACPLQQGEMARFIRTLVANAWSQLFRQFRKAYLFPIFTFWVDEPHGWSKEHDRFLLRRAQFSYFDFREDACWSLGSDL